MPFFKLHLFWAIPLSTTLVFSQTFTGNITDAYGFALSGA